jgi:hypothetical protein
MATPVDFKGTNIAMLAPDGREDIADVKAFTNGRCFVTKWKLTADELAEISRTGCVFVSLFGNGMQPLFVGGAEEVRGVIVDYGPTFPSQETPA